MHVPLPTLHIPGVIVQIRLQLHGGEQRDREADGPLPGHRCERDGIEQLLFIVLLSVVPAGQLVDALALALAILFHFIFTFPARHVHRLKARLRRSAEVLAVNESPSTSSSSSDAANGSLQPRWCAPDNVRQHHQQTIQRHHSEQNGGSIVGVTGLHRGEVAALEVAA